MLSPRMTPTRMTPRRTARPPARPRVRFVTEVGQVVEFEGKPSFSTRGHWHKAADSPGAPPLDVHCVTQPACAMCYETNMDDCNRFGGGEPSDLISKHQRCTCVRVRASLMFLI